MELTKGFVHGKVIYIWALQQFEVYVGSGVAAYTDYNTVMFCVLLDAQIRD